jgi:hypothetical protein
MRSSIELNDVKREAHNALFDLFHVECRDIIGTIHTGIETAQQGLAGVKYLLNMQILPISRFPLSPLRRRSVVRLAIDSRRRLFNSFLRFLG